MREKSASQQGEELAHDFRTRHHLDVDPLGGVSAFMAIAGFDVVVRDMPDGLATLTVKDPLTQKLVIGVATSRSPYRQIFSIAHEIGHIEAGDISAQAHEYQCTKRSPEEIRADSFARNLLCPIEAVKDTAQSFSGDSVDLLAKLVQRYRVSPSVAAIQMKNAGLIDEAEFEDLKRFSARDLAYKYGWIAQYDADVAQSRQPLTSQQLIMDTVQAYHEGKIPIDAVVLVRGLSVEQAQEEMAELSVGFCARGTIVCAGNNRQ
ncbi:MULTISPECIES: ImmA/IrrE family metallo-endopeptidase [Arcanobacterium]|uniref:ImmA/IrrE family metallo-endopeptidase n=1 Tax=Arcanobacterium buesumense TaxID=2722751 RepID=A0A6H2EME6_9ACTO|nr:MULTISPECIES: ImmA/IrrE family metallo-endopeptidase [Arcanobacterium]QJC22244.1 ImmA/IrrE family metallo-endopeptidase [Arcanobacterium buesumense]